MRQGALAGFGNPLLVGEHPDDAAWAKAAVWIAPGMVGDASASSIALSLNDLVIEPF